MKAKDLAAELLKNPEAEVWLVVKANWELGQPLEEIKSREGCSHVYLTCSLKNDELIYRRNQTPSLSSSVIPADVFGNIPMPNYAKGEY